MMTHNQCDEITFDYRCVDMKQSQLMQTFHISPAITKLHIFRKTSNFQG